MCQWLNIVLAIALSGSLSATLAFAQGADRGSSKENAADPNVVQSQDSMNRATPDDLIDDVNGNGVLDSGNSSGIGGNESPATEDTSLFDIDSRKNNAGSADLFDDAPTASNTSKGSGKVSTPLTPEGAAAAKATTAPPVIPLNNTSPTNPALPTPVAAPPKVSNPPSDVATGQEALQAKPATLPPIEAPPLPPPNEFAGAPPIPGTMRAMAEGEAPEEYSVEHGDNLYDICDQMLAEAGYWPKLWALNPEIKNPHFIFPNMRLRFYAGDDDTPPYLQVVTEDDVIPVDKGALDESQLIAEKVFYPKNEAALEYVVEVVGPDQVDMLQDEILTGGRTFNASAKPVHVPAFIYKAEREPLGAISSGREGENSVGTGGRVFIDPESKVSVGTLYTVLRPAGEVENPDSGEFVGYRYYFVANFRITHLTADRYFSGLVEDAQFGVSPGDIIVAFISTKRSVPLNDAPGAVSGVVAHVVAWENADQEVGGRGAIALLDRGSNGGVTVGSYLPIYATPGFISLASGDKDLPIDYALIGAMRIIDVTDVGACGYIVRSTEHVRIGDRTNKG
jgi:hypothetical protein